MSGTETGDEPWPGFTAEAAQITNSRRTIGEGVLELLRAAILNGTLEPGRRLKQEELAKAVGVSRIPVRSALMQLESEGLVSFHHHRGAVVRTLTVGQVTEIYEIREVLERWALRKSFATLTPERVQRLAEITHRLDQEVEGHGFADLRTEFYRTLYNAEDNPELVKLIEDLRSRVGRYLMGRRLLSAKDGRSSHATLVECAASGDLERADGVLTEHLRAVGRGVAKIVATAKSGS